MQGAVSSAAVEVRMACIVRIGVTCGHDDHCWLQNPFKCGRELDGLQSTLAGVPTVGVYLLGAALAAALGGVGFVGAEALAPGG